MEIAQSAKRHGVADDDILHAIAKAIALVDRDDGLLFIGADRAARLLEVIARQTPKGLVVFHAMPLRPAYRRYLP